MLRTIPLALVCATLMAQHKPLIEGNAKSTVRVVIYEDLACSDCAVFRRMMDEQLLPRFGTSVAFEHRDFPLPKHAWAKPAAIAARFFQSHSERLAVAYRRKLLEEMRSIKPETFAAHLAAFAKANGIDTAKAVAALDDPKWKEPVEQDLADGIARGIARTPTVLVDGEAFIETFTLEEIAKSIEAAVAEAKKQ
jgi:protein-disulfide isomerase